MSFVSPRPQHSYWLHLLCTFLFYYLFERHILVSVGILHFFSPRWMIGPVWVYPRADQAGFGRGVGGRFLLNTLTWPGVVEIPFPRKDAPRQPYRGLPSVVHISNPSLYSTFSDPETQTFWIYSVLCLSVQSSMPSWQLVNR